MPGEINFGRVLEIRGRDRPFLKLLYEIALVLSEDGDTDLEKAVLEVIRRRAGKQGEWAGEILKLLSQKSGTSSEIENSRKRVKELRQRLVSNYLSKEDTDLRQEEMTPCGGCKRPMRPAVRRSVFYKMEWWHHHCYTETFVTPKKQPRLVGSRPPVPERVKAWRPKEEE